MTFQGIPNCFHTLSRKSFAVPREEISPVVGMAILGESVDDYHYRIVSLRYRESGDEVDGDVFPRLLGDGVWL